MTDKHNMRPGDAALVGVVALVGVYDVLAREDETISDAIDRKLLSHRWQTELGCALLYAHVANKLPVWADPFHQAFALVRYVTVRARGALS